MSFEVIPLFAIPVYRTNLGSLDKSIRTAIESLDFERMPDKNGDYSVNKYVLDLPEFAALRKSIMDKVNHFVYDYLDCNNNMVFELENSWVNRHGRGDFAHSHWHGSSQLSGCYYIEIEEGLGDIVFHKDRSYINLFNPITKIDHNFETTGDQSKMNVFNVSSFGLCPRKNDLVLFPSHLAHSVDANQTDKTRYTLAFNVFPRGTSGGPINRLTV